MNDPFQRLNWNLNRRWCCVVHGCLPFGKAPGGTRHWPRPYADRPPTSTFPRMERLVARIFSGRIAQSLSLSTVDYPLLDALGIPEGREALVERVESLKVISADNSASRCIRGV